MRATLLKSVLSLVAVMAIAMPAEAQFGGLMRKAKEAAKDTAKEKDPRAAEPSGSTRNPFADPAIVFITQDQLGRFEKALQHEITQRNELRKKLASLPSREQYQSCSQSAAMSPESMKIVQDWAETASNAPPEQIMKLQLKMSEDMAAMLLKRCGEDPQKMEGALRERLSQFEAEASDIAMPPGYKPPVARFDGETPADRAAWLSETFSFAPARTSVALSYRAPRPFFPAAAPAAARAQMPNPHPFARAYAMLKERIPVFCAKLDAKAPLTPSQMTIGSEKVSVVKIPGQGQDYVFRQDEATALTAGCAGVMALMNSLFDSQVQ